MWVHNEGLGAGAGIRTRTAIRREDFKSVDFRYRPQPWTCLAILNSTETTDTKSLRQLSIHGGRC